MAEALGERDRCLYNDAAIRLSITAREAEITAVLQLIPADVTGAPPEQQALFVQLLQKIEKVRHEIHLDRCRIDFNAFANAVITDDETGEPIRQAPIHRRWAELCAENNRLIIWAHRNAGKTTQLSIARTVWELGRDPSLRFLILSNTASIATKIVKAISNLIKNSDAVAQIYPHLKPNKEGPWTTTELQVYRDSDSKDPSVRAAGVHGAVTSARIDRLVIDDILDFENTSTEKERKKLSAWYKATVPGCLTRRAKILIVGTAFSPHDFLHEMSKQRGWKWYRFPIISKTGEITWPEAWDHARIEMMKEELGPAEWARQLMCRARDDDESRFKQEWIDKAIERGEGLEMVHSVEELSDAEREGCIVYTGVDLGVKKSKRADKTAFFTFLEDAKGNRRVLEIASGKYTGPEIVDRVIDVHQRFGSIIAVESNAAQDYILQFARERSNVPVVPHTTSKMKRDPVMGVEGLAIELSNGKWIIPNDHKKLHAEVEAWINDMLFYSPAAEVHTGDRLMSCYFARELARRRGGDKNLPQVAVRTIGENIKTRSNDEVYREGPDLKKLFDV